MVKLSIFWVQNDQTSVRVRELEQARARSHAAKIAHQRRKNNKAHQDPPDEHGIPESLLLPTPTIYKGGSDPFCTTLVHVTPRVVQAFQFLKDALVPSTHFNTSGTCGSWSRSFLPDQTVRKHMEAMNDEWLALAEMLPLSAALTRISNSPELRTQTLRLKSKAIHRVYSKLRHLNDMATADHIIRLTRTLFAAATFENNMIEARMHGLALRKLLYQKTRQQGLEAVDMNLIWSTLYYDAQIAHTTMSLSIFDANWAMKRLELATRPLTRLLESLQSQVARDLDPVLKHSRLLQEFCIDIYQVTWLWGRFTPLSPEIDGPMMNLYATTRHNLFQLRLGNHYVRLRRRLLGDAAANRDLTKKSSPAAGKQVNTEAILTIALIAYLASFVGNSRIGGKYMWPRITLFISQLHYHLTTIGSSPETHAAEDSSQVRILLFAYWVGATWEHNDELTDSDVPSLWFTRGFVLVLRQMRLCSWQQIKAVLDRFVPAELARPCGSGWIDDLLGVPESGERAFVTAAGWTTLTKGYAAWKAAAEAPEPPHFPG